MCSQPGRSTAPYYYKNEYVGECIDAWYIDGNNEPLEKIWTAIREFGFPYRSTFVEPGEAMRLFDELLKFATNQAKGRVRRGTAFDVVPSSASVGLPYALVMYEHGDWAMNCITDLFTEAARMRACRVKPSGVQLKSPVDAFHASVPYLVEEVLRKCEDVCPANIREAMYTMKSSRRCQSFHEATTHGVSKVISVIQHFGAAGANVLDPCAGWGDRLIASLVCGCTYRGYDPNPDLKTGHASILSTLPVSKSASIECVPFEDAVVPDIGFRLVYTSPPYGTTSDAGCAPLELYGGRGVDRSGMSAVRYAGASWLDWLLDHVISKSWRYLDKGGYMVIHISDHGSNRIVGPMQRRVMSLGGTCLGVLGMEGTKTKSGAPPRPAWVFQK